VAKNDDTDEATDAPSRRSSRAGEADAKPSRRAYLRATLIALVIAINMFQGLPMPRIARHHLERPVGQRELARWTKTLQDLGSDITENELKEEALAFSHELHVWHGNAMRPFAWFFDALQIRQNWSLFPVADPYPWKMHLEGRATATTEWELLYTPLDPEHDFLDDTLEFRRIRAVWNPGTAGPRFDYPRFVDWVARQTFERRSDLDFVRVRFLRYHVPVPGEDRDPNETWHFDEIRQRAQLMERER